MTAFFMAWSMFCYIPCPVRKWDESKRQAMLACLPLVGLMIGAADCGAYALAKLLNLKYLGAAVLSFLPWMLCGFIHLDGFLDCADAVLSCRDEKRRLEILKDSHVGAFAVISVVILAFLSFAAWSELLFRVRPAVLLLIPAASRAVAGLCVLCCRPLTVSSYAAIHREGIRRRHVAVLCVLLSAIVAAGFVFAGLQGFSAAVTAMSCFLTVTRVKRKLGGMSGDVSGCAICISELMGVITLCFL